MRPSTTTTCAVVNRLDAPAISVEKEASPASGLLVGQTVTWTADVTSTGNVPLSSVQVADPQCAGGAMGYRSGDDGDAVLEDGETWRYDCTTTVTQADVDAGGRDNTATALSTATELRESVSKRAPSRSTRPSSARRPAWPRATSSPTR